MKYRAGELWPKEGKGGKGTIDYSRRTARVNRLNSGSRRWPGTRRVIHVNHQTPRRSLSSSTLEELLGRVARISIDTRPKINRAHIYRVTLLSIVSNLSCNCSSLIRCEFDENKKGRKKGFRQGRNSPLAQVAVRRSATRQGIAISHVH